jgi:hypothetical protein
VGKWPRNTFIYSPYFPPKKVEEDPKLFLKKNNTQHRAL